MLFSLVLIIFSIATINGSGVDLDQLFQNAAKNNKLNGINKNMYPKDVDYYETTFTASVDTSLITNTPASLAQDININGNGLKYKPSSSPRKLLLTVSHQDKNICGMVIGSGSSPTTNMLRVQVGWRPTTSHPFELMTVPNSGQRSYAVHINATTKKEFFMFDPVPAKQIAINILPVKNQPVSLTIALLHSCEYPNTVNITSCETTYSNISALHNATVAGPINVHCPNFCSSAPLCWGYKVYSAASPVCYTALNSLGNQGDGNLFVYPIKHVKMFRTQINSFIAHGTYCRSSSLPGPGYTFNRYYFDFSNNE